MAPLKQPREEVRMLCLAEDGMGGKVGMEIYAGINAYGFPVQAGEMQRWARARAGPP